MVFFCKELSLAAVKGAVLYFTLKGALIFNLLSAPISDSGTATALPGFWPVNNINNSYIFTIEAY